MKEHIVIFSHGFGVRKDDRGLFSDITGALAQVKSILFDYNEVDEQTGNLTVRSFSEQAKRLHEVIDEQRRMNPEAVINLICHSQVCYVVALANPSHIRKTIFLAPPIELGIERTLERYRKHPKAVIDLNGIDRLPRTDGSTTFVPAEYWRERMTESPPLESYNHLAEKTELIIVRALHDTVLGETSFEGLNPKARLMEIEGDHDFSSPNRRELIEVIKELLDISLE